MSKEQDSKKQTKESSEVCNKDNQLPTKNDDQPDQLSVVSDESLLGVFEEIMQNLRADRNEVSDLINNFAEMVTNSGDASSSSKEALVNLMKTKTDTADKMVKIADLMTRIKLKQPDTYKPYMKRKDSSSSGSGNTINIYDSGGVNRRALMDAIQKEKDKEQ